MHALMHMHTHTYLYRVRLIKSDKVFHLEKWPINGERESFIFLEIMPG